MIKQILREQQEIDLFLESLIGSEMIAVDIETDFFSKEKSNCQHLWLEWIWLYNWTIWWFMVHSEWVDYSWLDNLLHSTKVVFHNWLFDLQILLRLDYISELDSIEVNDTKILSFLDDENRASHHLKDLAIDILWKETVVKLNDVWERPRENTPEWQIKLWNYCVDDCIYTLELYYYFQNSILEQDKRILDIYNKVEMPLLKVLIEMANNWISIDTKYLIEVWERVREKILEAQIEIFKEAWTDFNISSNDQLQEIFQKKDITIPNKFKTPKWAISVWISTLKYLEEQWVALAGLVMNYREFTKLESWFTDSILSKVIKGKIHATYSQIWAVTWRLSCSEPNLMQLPQRDDEFDIRKAFISKPWHSFIIADLSNAELRMLAHFSQEPVLIEAFKNWDDIHQKTADKLWISRKEAKTITFWIIYWISAYWLADSLWITKIKADEMIKDYFRELPKVEAFIKNCIQTVKTNWFIPSILWRRRRFPEYNNRLDLTWKTLQEKKTLQLEDFRAKSWMDRQIPNSLLQGSVGDLMKLIMRNIQRDIKNLNASILVQIHDELIVECPDEFLEDAVLSVDLHMRNSIKLNNVPMKISLKVSKCWIK